MMIPYDAAVVKINKRLWVVVPSENWSYTPPDFLYKSISNREALQELADAIAVAPKSSWFHCICDWENKMRNKQLEKYK